LIFADNTIGMFAPMVREVRSQAPAYSAFM